MSVRFDILQIKGEVVCPSSDAPRFEADVPCAGCKALCCQHAEKQIPLDIEEAKRLPFYLGALKVGDQVVRNVAFLHRHPVTGHCIFLGERNQCTIWAERPRVCREYDCRTDGHPDLAAFARERFGGAK